MTYRSRACSLRNSVACKLHVMDSKVIYYGSNSITVMLLKLTFTSDSTVLVLRYDLVIIIKISIVTLVK